MTIRQLTSTAVTLPASATGAAGTPRGRLTLVVLVLLATVVLAVTALTPSAAPPVANSPGNCNSCSTALGWHARSG